MNTDTTKEITVYANTERKLKELVPYATDIEFSPNEAQYRTTIEDATQEQYDAIATKIKHSMSDCDAIFVQTIMTYHPQDEPDPVDEHGEHYGG